MLIRRIIVVVFCALAGLAYAQTLPVPTAISPTTATITSTTNSGTTITPLTITNSDGSVFTGSVAVTDPSGYTAVVGGPAIVLGPTLLSASSFNAIAGDATVTIGSLSTNVTSGIAKPNYSLVTTCGANCADSAKFSISGNLLKVGSADVVCASTTPCSYQVTVRDADTEPGAKNSPFDQHLTLTGNIKINSVLLAGGTTGTFTAPAGPSTSAGALSATCSNGPCGSLTFSESTTQGGCNGTNGANNSSFTASGGNILVNSGTPAGTYKICVIASSTAYSNSPVSGAFTITGVGSGIGACNPSPCPPGSIVPPGATWTLSFDEEFPGTSINTTTWNVPPDGSTFPSGQTEHCSAYLSVNNGTLSITSPGTFGDSCAINTKATWGFGYYEANVWTGRWPADWSVFWILSNGNASSSDPAHCTPIDNGFEADIIETFNTSQQNVYWSGYVAPCAKAWHGGGNGKVGDTYHVYGLDVETTGFTFYVDGIQTAQFPTTLLPGDTLNEYIILQNIFQASITQGLHAHWVRFFHH